MNFHQVDEINTQSKYMSGDLEKVSNLIARYRYQVRVESMDQHKTAEQMYGILKQEIFLLWAICILQLQVFGSHKGSTLLTKLEDLLKQHIESHGLKEPKCLLLHIYALERQAKYTEALAIFSKQKGEHKVPEVDKLHIEGRLLARSCDYEKAAEVFRKVLQEWLPFFSYTTTLRQKIINGMNVQFDSRMLIATQFVKDLIPKAEKNGLRMPAGTNDIPRWHHLACLEIECRKILQGRGDDQKLMMALVNYFQRLGHLAWFSSAALLFLKVLTHAKRKEFGRILMAMFKSMPVMSLKRICKATTAIKLLESLGIMFGLAVVELENRAVIMTQLYAESLLLSKDLQENIHCEELISMTCNVLVQLFWRTQDLGYLLEAIAILEFGLIIKRYKTLGYEYILLETMSHHILPQLLFLPFGCVPKT